MSKIKNLAMQSAFTNICGGEMGHSEELSEFKCGTVIGCHLYHKSVHEMSSLLEIKVNCKWYCWKVDAFKKLKTTHSHIVVIEC